MQLNIAKESRPNRNGALLKMLMWRRYTERIEREMLVLAAHKLELAIHLRGEYIYYGQGAGSNVH